MSDGLSEEAIAIDGLKLVRLRISKNGEGHSLWIGEHCTAFGIHDLENANRQANEIEEQITRVFVKVLVPDLVGNITRDVINFLSKK